MSMPLEQQPQQQMQQQQQQPPPLVSEQLYTNHSSHGSIGAVIAVLAVITVLGVVAGMIGRLCSGRSIMGHGHYDLEGWVERKCSSCIDGSIGPPPPSNTSGSSRHESIPVAIPVVEISEEVKHTEHFHQNPPSSSFS